MLDATVVNWLPTGESECRIIDPAATGFDDNGQSAPLDFIADLTLSVQQHNEIWLGCFTVSKELVSGIFMAEQNGIRQPVLSFTVLRDQYHYGEPIFLNQLADGYSGWLVPGYLNIYQHTVVHYYSSPEQSRIAERCLTRFTSGLLGIIDAKTGTKYTGNIIFTAGDGIDLSVFQDTVTFKVKDENLLAVTNGINDFPAFKAVSSQTIYKVGGVEARNEPGQDGVLKIKFRGPFVACPVKDGDGTNAGIALGILADINDLCPNRNNSTD